MIAELAPPTGAVEPPAPTRHELVQLLRRNAVVFQVAFGLLWSLRLVAAVGAPEVALAAAVIGALAVRSVARATRGLRARDAFRTDAGRRFLRPATRLTLVQLAASVALPLVAGALGAAEWSLPLVAITIGLFLVAFGRHLDVGPVSRIGAVATLVCGALPLVANGSALLAATSAVMVATLLASGWWCAHAASARGS